MVLVTVDKQRIIFWLLLVNNRKCLVPNKKKLVVLSNRVTSCNSRNNNHSNNSKMTIDLLKRSEVLVVINHTNHLRHLSSLKSFMLNKNVPSNTIGSETLHPKKCQHAAVLTISRINYSSSSKYEKRTLI